MPSVHVLYDVAGWAYHHLACALRKYAPPDIEVTMGLFGPYDEAEAALGEIEPDILVVQRQIAAYRVKVALDRRGWKTRLVVIWSCGWPRRIEHLPQVCNRADVVVFNNHEYWNNAGRLPGTRMIPNGVDLDIFKVKVPLEERQPKVLWLGSEVNHHVKGYTDYLLPLKNRLTADRIACDFRLVDSYGDDKLDQQEMADWYNTGTVLVCASQAEGTPNTALEAAACGCTVVSTRVGNMPELIRDGRNGYLVDRRVGALHWGVAQACKNYLPLARELQNDIPQWGWAGFAAQFHDLFRDLTTPRKARPPAVRKPDLSSEVTVFVTTVGAPTFESCLMCLRQQDCSFRLELIDHVAPMDAAFQRMLDLCMTPYYVQVDEDMLLYPHAIRTLYESMQQQPPSVALYVGWLHDAHLGEHIHGVKIFRHDVVRNYPLADTQGCEMEQIRRLQEDGYSYAVLPRGGRNDPFAETLGLHGTRWTSELIYARYAVLEERRRRRSGVGARVPGLPVVLAEKFREDPSELNFFALMGAIAGTLGPVEGRGHEKDYTQYGSGPAFQLTRRLFREATGEGRRDVKR